MNISSTPLSLEPLPQEPLSFQQIVDTIIATCVDLPLACAPYETQIRELRDRLAQGKLHLAVLGQFNRGKSTFLNALIGRTLLPTSVLPLTNVPTIIRYGATVRCTIHFEKNLPAKSAETDDGIRELLTVFVTEEKNSKNARSVKQAEIECPSEFLQNGIVLIDTPGFGSTYAHNTQATLDLLHECDAAFFLLSADLPITQVEIDFLREIKKFVPRLFFIFNKIDLLSNQEQIQTDLFIKKMITQNFGYSTDLTLFPVCARKALLATTRTTEDVFWKESGIDRVVKALERFITGEKYFTLSHALLKKTIAALDALVTILNTEVTTLEEPSAAARSRITLLKGILHTLEESRQRERDVLAAEKRALAEFIDKTTALELKKIEGETERAIRDIIGRTGMLADPIQALKGSFPAYFNQTALRLCAIIGATATKPLRKAIRLHELMLVDAYKSMPKDISSLDFEKIDTIRRAAEEMEFLPPPPPEWNGLDEQLALIQGHLQDRFLNKTNRIEQVAARSVPALTTMLAEHSHRISHVSRDQLNSLFDQFGKSLDSAWEALIKAIASTAFQVDTELSAQDATALTRSAYLRGKHEELLRLRGMIDRKE